MKNIFAVILKALALVYQLTQLFNSPLLKYTYSPPYKFNIHFTLTFLKKPTLMNSSLLCIYTFKRYSLYLVRIGAIHWM